MKDYVDLAKFPLILGAFVEKSQLTFLVRKLSKKKRAKSQKSWKMAGFQSRSGLAPLIVIRFAIGNMIVESIDAKELVILKMPT